MDGQIAKWLVRGLMSEGDGSDDAGAWCGFSMGDPANSPPPGLAMTMGMAARPSSCLQRKPPHPSFERLRSVYQAAQDDEPTMLGLA
jgi:hypothetical protein